MITVPFLRLSGRCLRKWTLISESLVNLWEQPPTDPHMEEEKTIFTITSVCVVFPWNPVSTIRNRQRWSSLQRVQRMTLWLLKRWRRAWSAVPMSSWPAVLWEKWAKSSRKSLSMWLTPQEKRWYVIMPIQRTMVCQSAEDTAGTRRSWSRSLITAPMISGSLLQLMGQTTISRSCFV